jgi:uncharacterized repeat protein (TIGR01451 family)
MPRSEQEAMIMVVHCSRIESVTYSTKTISALMLAVALLLPRAASAQVINQYTNTTTAAITDNNCGTAAQITRVFPVSTSYIVGDVELGLLASHTYRSDLRITLTSPAGTAVTVMTWSGNVQSGDNFHDLFDDEAAGALTTHNATVTDPLTPAPPPYSHSFQPSNPLSAFDGQNALGNWTMVLCDGVGSDTGQFQRADLFIRSTSLTSVKSSSVVSDPVNLTSNPKAIPGATIRYCILITNAGITGVTASSAVTVSDPVPASMTYIPGTLRSGTSCAGATTVEDDDAAGADESDPFGLSVTGSTVTGTTASMVAGATFAMVFDATIN